MVSGVRNALFGEPFAKGNSLLFPKRGKQVLWGNKYEFVYSKTATDIYNTHCFYEVYNKNCLKAIASLFT